MRVLASRRRLVLAAVATAGAALLAACGQPVVPSPSATSSPDPTPPAVGPAVPVSAGTALVSNGTSTVLIGDRAVTFPTTVTDAALSADGSRIVFVDSDGNIATAHLNGTGLTVLTKTVAGAKRSVPVWYGDQIVFNRTEGGTTKLHRAPTSTTVTGDPYVTQEQVFGEFDLEATKDATFPSASGVVGAGAEFAYQKPGANGPEVWIGDTNQRTPYARKLTDGSSGALSPDGKKIAYIGRGGQVFVVSTVDEGAKPAQVTFGAVSPSHLVWTPTGSGVAYSTPTSVESVSASVPKGATTNPPTTVSKTPGVATYMPPSRDRLVRINTADPIAAAVNASTVYWPNRSEYNPGEGFQANGAVLTGTGASGATSVAAARAMHTRANGPLLLTGASTLDSRTKAELRRILGTTTRLEPGNRPVITIIGGTDVVSAKAENDVKAMGYATERIAGPSLTTLDIPESIADYKTLYVVDVADPDAVAKVLALRAWNTPVLFSERGVLPAKTQSLLSAVKDGSGVTPVDAAAERAVRANWPNKRTLTITPILGLAEVARQSFGQGGDGIVLVDRAQPMSTLVAGALAYQFGYLVVPVDPSADPDPALLTWLDANSATMDTVAVVDGKTVIRLEMAQSMATYLSGPLGYVESVTPKA